MNIPYYQDKYDLSVPHDEVTEVMQIIPSGHALDLGCGRGRNSIMLRTNGYDVTSRDILEGSIDTLKGIMAAEEECQGIDAAVYDIQTADIQNDYDIILCLCVLQFLRADCIEAVIRNVQERTKPGGCNAIIAPMTTTEFPCPIDFPFLLKQGEITAYYKDWNVHKYNEDMGKFHRKDENGNFHQAKFATLIAQKSSA